MDPDQNPGQSDEQAPLEDTASQVSQADSAAEPQQGNEDAGQQPESSVENGVQSNSPTDGQQQPVDWQAEAARIKSELETRQKAYQNLRPAYTKATQELSEIKRRYDGIDPDAVRAWRQAQEEAKAKALPAWHPKHPESQKTMAALGRVESYRKAINAIPQEQRQAQAAAIAQALGVNEQDIQLAQQYQQTREQTIQEFGRDPDGWLATRMGPMVQETVQQILSQERERFQADQSVGDWFQKNEPIAKEYGKDMQEVILGLQEGKISHWDAARELAVRQAEIERLRAMVHPSQQAAASAQAKEQLLRTRATGQRQPISDQQVSAETIRRNAARNATRRGLNPSNLTLDQFHEAINSED